MSARREVMTSALERLAEAALANRISLEVTVRAGNGKAHVIRLIVEEAEEDG